MNDQTPASPFDPFEPSPRSADFQTQLQNGEQDEEFYFEAAAKLAPMPDGPPPPPPATPREATVIQLPDSGHVIFAEEQVGVEIQVDKRPVDMSKIPQEMPQSPMALSSQVPSPFSSPSKDIAQTQQQNKEFTEASPTIVKMPEGLPPHAPSSSKANRKTKTKTKSKKSKKKKKDKKDKKKMHKITTASDGNAGSGKSYSQYNSKSAGNADASGSGDNISYYDEEGGEERSSVFGFCKPDGKQSTMPPPSSNINAWSKTDSNAVQSNYSTGTGGNILGRRSRSKINTGILNSAAGEGTTVPQILAKIRFVTLVLSGLTFAFEFYCIFFHILFLRAAKLVLGCYLLFFVALLLLFELVRGDPIPAHQQYNSGSVAGVSSGLGQINYTNGNINVNMSNAAQVADIVWKLALEKKWARQIRYFLQNNFGILYSCMGRGLFLCFVGTVALGQGFPVVIVGAGFLLMGLWTISLSFRFPALEKAMVMDLEGEFGGYKDDASVASSAVTWSSLRSSARSEEHDSLLRK